MGTKGYLSTGKVAHPPVTPARGRLETNQDESRSLWTHINRASY